MHPQLLLMVLLTMMGSSLLAPQAQAAAPTLEARECANPPTAFASRLSCKLLVVPLDRSRADSMEIGRAHV